MASDSARFDSDSNGGCAAPDGDALAAALDDYEPSSAQEVRDVNRIRSCISTTDVWTRSSPLHVTGSALILHPPSRRVLLRWHDRMGTWLQVGGHADDGETDPYAVALREAREETGLDDLAPWPGGTARPQLAHVVIVPVPAGRGEPAHEHADLRYLLATARPDDAVPETETAHLQWLPVDDAITEVANDNLRLTLDRVAAALNSS